LPDRVLYVGNDRAEAYLYLNENLARGKYIALSHCWGGKESLCTSGKTLSMHTRGIPFSHFPKTFQHAILICRGLGVNYLWIDSLCIIQDLEEDWALQSARMTDVYSNSWVTIAADAATNSNDGFINDERRKIKVKRFECPGPGTQDSEVCIRRKGYGLQDSFHHHCWTGPARSPLSLRGWILQESVLAPRILHFTAEELTWECTTQSRCECQVQSHRFSSELPIKASINELPFRKKWSLLVEEFSERDLSFQTDRLPAISGLATWMQKSTDASYWAGLWSDDFPGALLWWVLDRKKDVKANRCISTRILPYQAPTWSWASVTGRILLSPYSDKITPDLENIRVEVVPAGANLYGSLRSAQLSAKAYLVSVQVSNELGQDGEYVGYDFHVISEGAVDGGKLTAPVVPDIQGDGYDINIHQLHFVLIVGHVGNSAHCILLRNVQQAVGKYERVGYLHQVDYGKWLEIAIAHDLILV
jgi:Heterokaryon incompatibility protein (HET)